MAAPTLTAPVCAHDRDLRDRYRRLSHIVVGSFEAFMLLANFDIGLGEMLTRFWIPVLLGNVIGGTALFALLAYAQVMKEV